jgi:hypothetical protein
MREKRGEARAKAQSLFRGFGDRESTGDPTAKLSRATHKSTDDERVDNPWGRQKNQQVKLGEPQAQTP